MPYKPTKNMENVAELARRGVFKPIGASSKPEMVWLMVMFEHSITARMAQRRGMDAATYYDPRRAEQLVDLRNVNGDGNELTSDTLSFPIRDIDRVIALLTAMRQHDRDLGLGPLGRIAVLNEINEKLLAPAQTTPPSETIP